jgi:poly(A) polymerase
MLPWYDVRLRPVSNDRLSQAQRRAVRELLRIAPVIDELGARFHAAGAELSLVGGSVRDALLGRLGKDLDFTTSARPDTVERLLAGWADAMWDIGRAYGTIGARKRDWTIEITTFRADTYDPESRKPDVAYGDSLEGDLGRRDFTVNALAYKLPDQVFVDPFGGVTDLVAGVLRTPGRP